MGYCISVLKNESVIVCNHRGTIERDELGAAWQAILNKAEFSELDYNLLADIRETTITSSEEELLSMLDFLNSFRAILTGKRLALIADSPQVTALSMLFEHHIPNDLGMLTKTFSTPEAALRFVKK